MSVRKTVRRTRQTEIRIVVLLVVVLGTQLLSRAHGQPSFAEIPVIVEYDVDPSWPQYPEDVSREGWVSGLAVDAKDQVFMRFSTDGRVRQVWSLPLGESKDKLKPGETIGVHCIVEDSRGNIFVGDIYGERAQEFIPVTKR